MDDGGGCIGGSVATAETCGCGCDHPQLRGLSASWRVGDATCGKSGEASPARNGRSNRALLVGDSGGTKWHSQQNTDTRRFSDPQQAGPLVDGSTLERSGEKIDHKSALLISVCQNEMVHEVNTHFRRAWVQQVGRCGVQPETWGAAMGLHEKVLQSRRNSATGSLAQFVECPGVPKSVKTSKCNAVGGASTGRFRTVLRRQPRAPARRSHGRTVFPWTGHRCFVKIGNAPACVSRAIKRHGVEAEIWSPWYGVERDIAQNDKKAQLVKRIRRRTSAGILLTPPCYALSKSRRGKPDSGWPVALRHDSCPEGFSCLTSDEWEALSRVNMFEEACAHVVFEAINEGIPVAVCHATSSYMWSLHIYRCLLNLCPAIAQLAWCLELEHGHPFYVTEVFPTW